MDALSGPRGSPFDRDTTGGVSAQASTGAMSTGIGYGNNVLLGLIPGLLNADSIERQGFNDDQDATRAFTNSTIMYIGGGKCTATVNGTPPPVPYTAGFLPLAAGNGGSRDAGAGPAFTGFTQKMVTAIAQVINSGVVETGWLNRTGVTIEATQSVLGSSVAASAAPA
jgi:hypothetical protein